jgi:adenylate cyclase
MTDSPDSPGHDQALEHHRKAASLEGETQFRAHGHVMLSLESLGRHQEALAVGRETMSRIEKTLTRSPDDTRSIMDGANTLAFLGEKERAREWIRRVLILEPDDAMVQYNMACALAQIGETEQSIELLETAWQKIDPGFINWMKNDSDLASLRDHPRYRELIRRGEAQLIAARVAEENASARIGG